MQKAIHLSILSPEATIFTGEALAVWLPGSVCPFEILPDHAPLISTLSSGNITIRKSDLSLNDIVINGGIAKISDNRLIVCVG